MAVIKSLIVHDEVSYRLPITAVPTNTPPLLLSVRQSHACEAMELFDEMIECELSLVGPHLQLLVQFCLEVYCEVNV